MKLGEIYKSEFDERPFRIIGLDEFEVFYDCPWDKDNWTFSGNFKAKSVFYRMSASLFKTKSELIDYLELSEEEHRFFRPDLPMRFGRTKNISWNSFGPGTISILDQEFTTATIGTDKIILVPYGPNGAFKRGELITCSPGLTVNEVIKRAKELQESVNKQVSNGIGIYRLGCQKASPSYSIGEYFDRAGILTK